ncbi:cache domain-containing sensor histidine kinase [Bacillus alkalicellulosilyticus]|uniref:cache domain-containing sensor histidine kinase n=1 Tax=Alkalihalobacterium alkalicellulosilyticum TaxID=1912214 RepID=UPI000997CE5C|nr:sensor histidine kinase [Bacillus alkalicellulosilyticus]
MRLQYKVIIGFIVLVILPIVILGMVSYHTASMMIQEKISEQTIRTLKSTELNILGAISEIDSLSNTAIVSNDVQETFKKHWDFHANYHDIYERNRIEQALTNLLYINPKIHSVVLFTEKGLNYQKGLGDPLHVNNTHLKRGIKKAVENDGRPVWLGTTESHRILTASEPVFTHLRIVKDRDTMENLGFLLINVKTDILERIFFELYKGESLDIMLIDNYRTILYSPEQDLMGYFLEFDHPGVIFSEQEGSFIESWNGEKSLVTYVKTDHEWTLVSIKPLNLLMAETNDIKYTVATLVIVVILLAVLFNFVYIRKIVYFIDSLNTSMKKVASGQLDVEMPSYASHEMNTMALGFNRMVKRIKQLLYQVKKEQQSKEEAEFKALQAQINPHFLYNTLESINAMAALQGQKDISRMTVNLGKLLRISFSKSPMIKVKDEIQHIQSYLEIQKVRHGDLFSFVIDVDPKMLEFSTLKLILQPIIENAIIHGIELKDEFYSTIKVIGRMSEGRLIFLVEDDGVGFTEEALQAVNEKRNMNLGLGIQNVYERIRLYYGDSYGVIICSTKGVGTVIKITIPITEVRVRGL